MATFESTSVRKMMREYRRYLAEFQHTHQEIKSPMVINPLRARLNIHAKKSISRLTDLLRLEFFAQENWDALRIARLVLYLHEITGMEPEEFLPTTLPNPKHKSLPTFEDDEKIPNKQLVAVALSYYLGITVKKNLARAYKLFKKAGALSEKTLGYDFHTARYLRLKMAMENPKFTVFQLEEKKRQPKWMHVSLRIQTLSSYLRALFKEKLYHFVNTVGGVIVASILVQIISLIAFAQDNSDRTNLPIPLLPERIASRGSWKRFFIKGVIVTLAVLLYPVGLLHSLFFVLKIKLDPKEEEKFLLFELSYSRNKFKKPRPAKMNYRNTAYPLLKEAVSQLPDHTPHKTLLQLLAHRGKNIHNDVHERFKTYTLLPADIGIGRHPSFRERRASRIIERLGIPSNTGYMDYHRVYLQQHCDRDPRPQTEHLIYEQKTMQALSANQWDNNSLRFSEFINTTDTDQTRVFPFCEGYTAQKKELTTLKNTITNCLQQHAEAIASFREARITATTAEAAGTQTQIINTARQKVIDTKQVYSYLCCFLAVYAADTWDTEFLPVMIRLIEEARESNEVLLDDLIENTIKEVARYIRSDINIPKQERLRRINCLLAQPDLCYFDKQIQDENQAGFLHVNEVVAALKTQRSEIINATFEYLMFVEKNTTPAVATKEINAHSWLASAIPPEEGNERSQVITRFYQLKLSVLERKSDFYMAEKQQAYETIPSQHNNAPASREKTLATMREKALRLLREHIEVYQEMFECGLMDTAGRNSTEETEATLNESTSTERTSIENNHHKTQLLPTTEGLMKKLLAVDPNETLNLESPFNGAFDLKPQYTDLQGYARFCWMMTTILPLDANTQEETIRSFMGREPENRQSLEESQTHVPNEEAASNLERRTDTDNAGNNAQRFFGAAPAVANHPSAPAPRNHPPVDLGLG